MSYTNKSFLGVFPYFKQYSSTNTSFTLKKKSTGYQDIGG